MTSSQSLNQKVKVGFFVTVGAIIAALSIFVVGGDGFTKNHVEIFAEFESVQGLAEGSVVSLAGIKIGNIKGFEFNKAGKLVIVMKIDEDFLSRIPEGSTIEVRTAGALGDKFLYITPGPLSQRFIQPGGTIDALKASDLMSVISEKGGEARRIFEIMKETEILLKSLNSDNRIEKILTNLNASTAELKIAAKDAREMLSAIRDQKSPDKINASIEKFDRILGKIDRGEGTLGALINDSSLHESLKGFVGNSEKKKTVKSLIRSSIEQPEKD